MMEFRIKVARISGNEGPSWCAREREEEEIKRRKNLFNRTENTNGTVC